MIESQSELRDSVITLARRCAERGWTPATAGNFSARGSRGLVGITRSGADKGALTDDDILLLPLAEAPPKSASAEAPIHWALYRSNPEIGAVAHCHAQSATLISLLPEAQGGMRLAGWELLKAINGIATHETEIRIPVLPNTQDMAGLGERLAVDPVAPALLLRGHGIYAWGRTPAEAFRHLEALDFMFDLELKRRSLAL